MVTAEKLADLIERAPEAAQPLLTNYAVPLLRATAEEIGAAILQGIRGDGSAARRLALSKMTPAELDADDAAFTAQDSATAADNAAAVAFRKRAVESGASIALGLALTLV